VKSEVGLKAAWRRDHIVVQEQQDSSAREFCAPVARSAGSLVIPGFEAKGKGVPTVSEPLRGVINRSVYDDDDFVSRRISRLAGYSIEAQLQLFGSVTGRYDDAQFNHGSTMLKYVVLPKFSALEKAFRSEIRIYCFRASQACRDRASDRQCTGGKSRGFNVIYRGRIAAIGKVRNTVPL
jgi:hypothetical protein